MLIPSCIFLWHGLAVILEPVAAKEWQASAKLVTRHHIDINRPPAPVKAVPAERNFLGHPYFQALITQPATAKPDQLTGIYQIVKPHLPALPEAGDTGQGADLIGVMESLDSELPGLLENAGASESLGANLLAVLDRIGIPWQELTEAAARPCSQLPPMGSTPPADEFYQPANTISIAPKIGQFMKLAELRTHAALQSENRKVAGESLLLQLRVIDGYLEGRNLLYFIFGNAFTSSVLNQIREGMAKNLWHPADLDWFTGWIERSEIEPQLKLVLESELFFGLREIDFVGENPSAPDHQYAAISGTAAAGLLGKSGSPFSQDWLLPLRGGSELLYRSVPPAVFQLWKAHAVRTIYKKQLQPLDKIGLLGLVVPEEPDEFGDSPLSMKKLALGFARNKARIQLFLTSRALAQWHANYQEYPTDLELNGLARFKNFTTDPFSSRLLKYERLSPTAYRLYSFGADFLDQGGEPITDGVGDICWHRMENPKAAEAASGK